jgi:hypothetical protein
MGMWDRRASSRMGGLDTRNRTATRTEGIADHKKESSDGILEKLKILCGTEPETGRVH